MVNKYYMADNGITHFLTIQLLGIPPYSQTHSPASMGVRLGPPGSLTSAGVGLHGALRDVLVKP